MDATSGVYASYNARKQSSTVKNDRHSMRGTNSSLQIYDIYKCAMSSKDKPLSRRKHARCVLRIHRVPFIHNSSFLKLTVDHACLLSYHMTSQRGNPQAAHSRQFDFASYGHRLRVPGFPRVAAADASR